MPAWPHLGPVVQPQQWTCYAYCLMNNPYHLLTETRAGNLVRGVQHLNGIYTQAFNRRHDRVRTVKDADRIVALDQGWIVEDGTHNALQP
jgi:hypothetical protein